MGHLVLTMQFMLSAATVSPLTKQTQTVDCIIYCLVSFALTCKVHTTEFKLRMKYFLLKMQKNTYPINTVQTSCFRCHGRLSCMSSSICASSHTSSSSHVSSTHMSSNATSSSYFLSCILSSSLPSPGVASQDCDKQTTLIKPQSRYASSLFCQVTSYKNTNNQPPGEVRRDWGRWHIG